MKNRVLIVSLALLAALLAAPTTSVAASSLTKAPAAAQRAALVSAPAAADADCTVFMTYQVRTAGGWGAVHCQTETAGCVSAGCSILAMRVETPYFGSIGYRVRTAVDWGDWKYDGETAGYTSNCEGCRIEMIQAFGSSGYDGWELQYRVHTDGGWGAWKSWHAGLVPPKAGCYGCTIGAIQMLVHVCCD